MDWQALRDAEFPQLARGVYLNSCSLGALPRRGRAAVARFLDLWEERGASAWYKVWLAEVDALRGSFARLVGADARAVAILPNVSSALGVLASAVPLDARPKVVTAALDFPTLAYQWRAKPEAKVAAVPSPDGVGVPRMHWDAYVDEATGIVATSHVFYTSGFVQDVGAISRLARRHGALSLLDAYQGTGQIPTDVREIGCDALLTGGLKWLLGGPGVAYLYVRRDLHAQLSPATTGWFAHARQFDFDAERFEPAPDARRFETGTPAMAAVYAGRAGLDLVNEIGAPRIRARTMDLVRDLVERLADAGFAMALPPEEARSAIVSVLVEDPKPVVARLAERGIVVDARPGRVRVSPYFYNTIEENATFADALRAVARPG